MNSVQEDTGLLFLLPFLGPRRGRVLIWGFATDPGGFYPVTTAL